MLWRNVWYLVGSRISDSYSQVSKDQGMNFRIVWIFLVWEVTLTRGKLFVITKEQSICRDLSRLWQNLIRNEQESELLIPIDSWFEVKLQQMVDCVKKFSKHLQATEVEWALCTYYSECSTVHVFFFHFVYKPMYSSCISLAQVYKKWKAILNSGHLTAWEQSSNSCQIFCSGALQGSLPLFPHRLPCIHPKSASTCCFNCQLSSLPGGHAN